MTKPHDGPCGVIGPCLDACISASDSRSPATHACLWTTFFRHSKGQRWQAVKDNKGVFSMLGLLVAASLVIGITALVDQDMHRTEIHVPAGVIAMLAGLFVLVNCCCPKKIPQKTQQLSGYGSLENHNETAAEETDQLISDTKATV